jgi:hypothetical protein
LYGKNNLQASHILEVAAYKIQVSSMLQCVMLIPFFQIALNDSTVLDSEGFICTLTFFPYILA